MENYEEKTKAYDEALEKAKEFYNSPRTCIDIEALTEIFPKLKESEDEHIRKGIIHFILYEAGNQLDEETEHAFITWLEKQKEQKPKMIQWTGKNLKQVIDFTGKSPRFDEWFKSWEEYENYVHIHNDILKLFCEDGSHYEVPAGAWIVKTPDGHNVPSVAKYVQQEQLEGGCSEKPNDLLSKQEPTCKDYTHSADVGKMEQPEGIEGVVHHYANIHYINTNQEQLNACLKDFEEGAEVRVFINARKKEKSRPPLPPNLDEAAEEFGKRQGVELKPFARKFFKAGAEWMAGQFQKIEGDLVDWYSTSDGKEYCCGIKPDEAFEIPEGFYIRKKQQPSER